MDWVLAILVFLHVIGAIVAFGPTFAFPIIGAMGGKEPQHVNFALRVNHAIERRMTLPLAVLQGITGVAIVWIGHYDVTKLWLGLGIVLYLIALGVAYFVADANIKKLVEATNAPPPPPAPGSPPPSGPPPHIAALIKKQQQTGMLLAVLLVAIIFLMSAKPFSA
ncbi:MAG: putative integral rane protein [Chloroflexota bacterium]|jgi:uncharacterized membrane protein|nr:putative integral rane protein [Chloroflexota bacterium]